jgi:lipopolysaccharide biosynthesis regulator YciM
MLEYTFQFLILLLVVVAAYLIYERFFSMTSKPDSRSYVDALRDLLDGRQESAFSKLRQVVAEDAGNLDAYIRLGRILRENNQPVRALQVHKDLTLRSGLHRTERTAILREIAADCLALDDAKTAEAALRELLALDAADYWGNTHLLSLQEKTQRWDEAYDTAVQILKLEGNKSKKPLARFKYEAGRQHFRKREYHKARVAYKEAIGLDPSLVAAYLSIGDSYYEEKRFEDALTFWNKLITSVPDQGHRVINRLQKTLFELGRFGEIQSICEAILDHSPRNFEARHALAVFYEKKGSVDQAIEIWESILEEQPDDGRATLDLVRVYLEKGFQKKVLALIKTLQRKREQPSGQTREADQERAASPSES